MSFDPIISFIEFNQKVFKRIKISKLNFFGIEVSIDEKAGNIDDRIKKIELAKQNLQEGLTAIEELQNEAEKNKKEVEAALSKLSELNNNRSTLEEEVKSIKQVIASDVATFQKVAGVPSPKEIRKERIIGFISGVIASVVASGLVWLIVTIIKNYLSKEPSP